MAIELETCTTGVVGLRCLVIAPWLSGWVEDIVIRALFSLNIVHHPLNDCVGLARSTVTWKQPVWLNSKRRRIELLIFRVTKQQGASQHFDDRGRSIGWLSLSRVLLKLFHDDSGAAPNVFDQLSQSYCLFDHWKEQDHIEWLIVAIDPNDKDLISQQCQVKRCWGRWWGLITFSRASNLMAVGSEFVLLMKRSTRPVVKNVRPTVKSGLSPTQPMQLSVEETDLRWCRWDERSLSLE